MTATAGRGDTPPATRAIRLRAPGRLHLGFLDPSATLGRRFGSIGLVIDGFETAVELSLAAADDFGVAAGAVDPAASAADVPAGVAAGDAVRAAAHLAALRERTGWRQPLRLRLLHTLPAHAGFGSGTQLALAVGTAFERLRAANHGGPAPGVPGSLSADGAPGAPAAPPATLARWLGRGARSGVGIAGFEHGGLLVDGGPAADGTPARLLSRIDFPADWRVVVVLDPRHRGLSGGREAQAIAELPALPQAAAADICHQLLMRVLPGAAAAEFAPFATGVSRIQRLLGEHFAPAQRGSLFSSRAVAAVMDWIDAHAGRPVGSGQSSWGPTAFAIVESPRAAQALVAAARAAGVVDAALDIRIVAGLNRGALVEAAAVEPAGTDPAWLATPR